MKIAVALSGEPRNFSEFWNVFLERLALPEGAVDFYLHTWINSGSVSNLPEHVERARTLGVDPSWYQSLLTVSSTGDFINTVQPKRALIEKWEGHSLLSGFFPSLSGKWIPRETKERTLSMFYGIESAMRLIDDIKGYDFIVRARPDVFFERPLNWSVISQGISESFDVIVPDLFYNVGGWPGTWTPDGQYTADFFWIFNPNMLEKFQNIFSELPSLCSWSNDDVRVNEQGDWAIHPETYLMRYMKSRGLRIGKLNNRMMLARQQLQIQKHGKLIAF